MKMKRIILLVIALIVVIALVPIIRNRILFYQVKDKVLANIYEVKREGNYHIIYHEISKDLEHDETYDQVSEIFGKDGKSITIRPSEENRFSQIVTIENKDETFSFWEYEDKINGIIQIRSIYFNDISNPRNVNISVLDEIFQAKFKKIEKGTYKGKDCYIAKLEYEYEDGVTETVYINPETYFPYGLESEDRNINYAYEYEWLTVELGTVDKLPEYDLDKIRANAVSAEEYENQ